MNTEITRYFKIANDLTQFVRVELEHAEKDEALEQANEAFPAKYENVQYLPPGCYTSF